MFFAGTLGVPTLEYLPYAVVPYITPLVAILYAVINKFIWYEEDEEASSRDV